MSKAMRTALSLVVSLVLLSALAMAEPGGSNNKDKNSKHHSPFAKLAFWRHHKKANKSARPAQAAHASSKRAQAKTTRLKPAAAKQADKKDQNQQQHASNVVKPSAKKAPAANKNKPSQKTQDPKTASLKQ